MYQLQFTTTSWAKICFLLASGIVFFDIVSRMNNEAIEQLFSVWLVFELPCTILFAILFGQAAGLRQASIPLAILVSLTISSYAWLLAKVVFPEPSIVATFVMTLVNLVAQTIVSIANQSMFSQRAV